MCQLFPEMHSPGSIPDLNGMAVFVAEDDPYSFILLNHLLKKTGAEIVHAEDGNQLLQLLETRTPELILLDISMPERDGHACLKEIRSRGIKSKIIVQSASALSHECERIMLAGADHYICKPFRKTELYQAIEKALSGSPDLKMPGIPNAL